jgi:hypothetical protein
VLGLVQRAEAAGDYDTDDEATTAMAADERVHALVVAGLAQRQRARASGWFRAAVFGANDGCPVSLDLVRPHLADLRRTRSAETPSGCLSHLKRFARSGDVVTAVTGRGDAGTGRPGVGYPGSVGRRARPRRGEGVFLLLAHPPQVPKPRRSVVRGVAGLVSACGHRPLVYQMDPGEL